MREFEWVKSQPGFYMTESEYLKDLCLADPSKHAWKFGSNMKKCWALYGGERLFFNGKTKEAVEEWAEEHAGEINQYFWGLQEQEQDDNIVADETIDEIVLSATEQIVADETIAPTGALYSAFNLAFDHFNKHLFGEELSPVILTFSLKNPKALGYYHHDKWTEVAGETVASEISLNPDMLKDRTLKEVLSTLVHEMCHHWQYQCGEPSRPGYHDREWAEAMIQLGLHPSNTGQPGGRETGQAMSHYILEGGKFEVAYGILPPEAALPWTTAFGATGAKKKPASKVSYKCGCRRFQAKAGLTDLLCTACGNHFVMV